MSCVPGPGATTRETSVTANPRARVDHSGVTTTGAPGDSALPDFDPDVIVDLDLREELRAGVPPLARINEEADRLGPGGVLHLRTPFQPRPLFALLGQRGFLHHSQPFAEDDWSSWFWRADTPPERRVAAPQPSAAVEEGVLDLRALPPPEPLLIILDRIGHYPEPFDVLLPFDPDVLRDFLAAQGWTATLMEVGTDGVRLRIEQENR